MSINWFGFRWALGLLAVLSAGVDAAGQEVRMSAKPYAPAPPAPVALRVETDLVEVGVVVRSHDGYVVPGLKRENFVVTDQGRPRELSFFAVETPAVQDPKTAPAGSADEKAAPAGEPKPPQGKRTAEPRFIALYFEDFTVSTGDLRHAQVAGRRFINEGVEDSDRVALFSTSGDFVDYTNDKAKLIMAIDKLKPHPKYYEAGNGCPRISAYQAYQIAVLRDYNAREAAKAESVKCSSADLDAKYVPGSDPNDISPDGRMITAQAEQMWGQVRVASQVTLDAIGKSMRSLQNRPGRRLLILVSAGFNAGTLEVQRDQLIDLALRAGIVVNALDAKGLVAESPVRAINDPGDSVGALPTQTFLFEAEALNSRLFLINQPMSDLAEATGGLFFHNNNDLAHGFRKLGSTPEVSYVLGFHKGDAVDGKYHKLKVSLVDTKPYLVQARPGYFASVAKPALAKAAAAPVAPGAREKLDREVSGTSTLADIPISVAYHLDSPQQAGMVTVKTQVHIGIDKLSFPLRDERRVQRLTFVTVLINTDGNIVSGKEGTMDFAMTEATYAKLSASGINAGLNLEVPPGKYRLRAVVVEAVEGKVASATVEVEVK